MTTKKKKKKKKKITDAAQNNILRKILSVRIIILGYILGMEQERAAARESQRRPFFLILFGAIPMKL